MPCPINFHLKCFHVNKILAEHRASPVLNMEHYLVNGLLKMLDDSDSIICKGCRLFLHFGLGNPNQPTV